MVEARMLFDDVVKEGLGMHDLSGSENAEEAGRIAAMLENWTTDG